MRNTDKLFLYPEEIEQYYELMFDEKNSILSKEDRKRFLELSDVIRNMEEEYDKMKNKDNLSPEENVLLSKYESFFNLIYKFDAKLLSSKELKKSIGSLSSLNTPSNLLKRTIFKNTLDNRQDQDEGIDYSDFLSDDEVDIYISFFKKVKDNTLTREEYFLYSSVSLKIFYIDESYNNIMNKEKKDSVDKELISNFETIFKKIDFIKARILSSSEIKEYINRFINSDEITPRGLLWRKHLEDEINTRTILNL